RAGRNTVSAAITGVRLNNDRIEFGPNDRVSWADLEASRLDAVLAHIAHQQPATVLAVFSELLDEFDMAPMNAVESARVVIAVAAQGVEAAVGARKLVPFFGGDLARFSADADGGVL